MTARADELSPADVAGLTPLVDDLVRLAPAIEAAVTERCGLAGVRLFVRSDDGRRLERPGATGTGDALDLNEGLAGRVASHGTAASAPDGPGGGRTAVALRARGEGVVGVLEATTGPEPIGPPVRTAAGTPARPTEGTPARATENTLARAAEVLAPVVALARRWRSTVARAEAAERFAERAILADEAERSRLAREIHDGVSQRLAGLGFHLSAAASLSEATDEASRIAVREALASARRLADLAGAETRAAIGGLRPPVLDDLGLVAALASLGREVAQRPGAPDVTVTVSGELERPLPDHVQTSLYRIGQEGLGNAVRHAQASSVVVRVEYGPAWVHLSVEDDGVGFAVEEGRASGARAGAFGLRSMRERADLLGGALHVASRSGVGTTIRVAVPV